MEYVNCILCHSENNLVDQNVVDRFNQKNSYSIVKCECEMRFLNPRVSIDEISKHYQHSSYQPHYKNNSLVSLMYQIAQLFNNRFKLKVIKRFYDQGSILDYGAGDGQFANFMIKKKWNVKIYEPLLKNMSDLSLNEDKIGSDSFDIITMFHSLEHIHNVEKTLQNLYNLLNKDGILIVSVPNHNAYERRFFKSKWIAYDAPRHLYHFNHETIKLFLNKNKFDVIITRSMYLDTLYNTLMSLNKDMFLFLKFIGISLISIFKTIRNKQYSSSILLVCKKR
jgi:2-polyprenyl-3-methyl-5-hydroxy-6-metoxy-1,4-benzoquinol methylase